MRGRETADGLVRGREGPRAPKQLESPELTVAEGDRQLERNTEPEPLPGQAQCVWTGANGGPRTLEFGGDGS